MVHVKVHDKSIFGYLWLLVHHVNPVGACAHFDWHFPDFFPVLIEHMFNFISYFLGFGWIIGSLARWSGRSVNDMMSRTDASRA